MEKSKHIYKNGIIPYQELSNFIEPVKANAKIPLKDMSYITSRDNYFVNMNLVNNNVSFNNNNSEYNEYYEHFYD